MSRVLLIASVFSLPSDRKNKAFPLTNLEKWKWDVVFERKNNHTQRKSIVRDHQL